MSRSLLPPTKGYLTWVETLAIGVILKFANTSHRGTLQHQL